MTICYATRCKPTSVPSWKEAHYNSLPKVKAADIEPGTVWQGKTIRGWETFPPDAHSFILNDQRVDHIIVYFECDSDEQEMLIVREG